MEDVNRHVLMKFLVEHVPVFVDTSSTVMEPLALVSGVIALGEGNMIIGSVDRGYIRAEEDELCNSLVSPSHVRGYSPNQGMICE